MADIPFGYLPDQFPKIVSPRFCAHQDPQLLLGFPLRDQKVITLSVIATHDDYVSWPLAG